MKTLEQILNKEKECRVARGPFGIDACKEMVRYYEKNGRSLYQQLEEDVLRANQDVFFNRAMILATWELINEEVIYD